MDDNNNLTNTYIGITLGPIDRVMSYTQSTKSFWGASYFLSYIGKRMVEDLFLNKGRRFLKPLLKEEMWSIQDGVGRFPDQYIFQAKEGDWDSLMTQRDTILNELGKQVALTLKLSEKSDEITCYLKQVVKIYLLEMQCTEAHAVELCQQQLSVMECQDIYPDNECCNYLMKYFEAINQDQVLLNDAYGADDPKKRNNNRLFPTIIERAGALRDHELKNMNELNDDAKVSQLAPIYKYIAFVSADGDNIGKALAKLGVKISDKLLSYNTRIVEVVEKRYGQVIYAGGDDLVFFAPIADIFLLIQEIDEMFNQLFSDKEIQSLLTEHKLTTPSLSFGVTIAYHKHPMSESLTLSEELLHQAKEQGRNRILWNMRKHSGQSIESPLTKPQLALATDLIKGVRTSNHIFLHSVAHYLHQHQVVIAHLLGGESAEVQLQNYMDSTFDDDSHTNHTSMLQSIRTYLLKESQDHSNKLEVIGRMVALLRYIELIIKPSAKEQSQKGGAQ